MSRRVYQCIEWVEATHECAAAAWVEHASVLDALPTLEQANGVGGAMFLSLAVIAAMTLLSPPRSFDNE
ncbi:hypothetical protein ACW7G2_02020 [Luteimonas sp. A277]